MNSMIYGKSMEITSCLFTNGIVIQLVKTGPAAGHTRLGRAKLQFWLRSEVIAPQLGEPPRKRSTNYSDWFLLVIVVS